MEFYDKALSAFKRSVELATKRDTNYHVLAHSYIGLASTFCTVEEFDSMRLMIFKSKEIQELSGDSILLPVAYQWMGNGFYYEDKLDSAVYYYNLSAEIANLTGDYDTRAYSVQNMGWVAYSKNDYGKAREYFLKSIKLFDYYNNIFAIIYGYRSLSQLGFKTGNNERGMEYGQLAIESAIEKELLSALRDTYRALAEACQRVGMHEKAIDYFLRQDTVRDEILNSREQQKMGTLENEALLNLQKRADSLNYTNQTLRLENQKKRSEEKAASGAFLRNIIIGFVLLIFLISVFFHTNLKKRFKQSEKQKQIIAS